MLEILALLAGLLFGVFAELLGLARVGWRPA